MAAVDGKNIPPGGLDTAVLDLFGKETGDSVRLGGPTAYFWRLRNIDVL